MRSVIAFKCSVNIFSLARALSYACSRKSLGNVIYLRRTIQKRISNLLRIIQCIKLFELVRSRSHVVSLLPLDIIERRGEVPAKEK
jgi:hypothetical protein